jgi:selT/selW/selH-like putative selenoprotein
MEFTILYCEPCGYRDRADQLAEELRRRFDAASVNVEEGKFGQFDVLLDGLLVASKGGFWKRKLTHGAPPQTDILAAIDRAIAEL